MIIVVYRKKTGIQKHLAVFTKPGLLCDDIITTTKRKPLIPHDWHIEELGMGGEKMIEGWSKKHSIKITQKIYNPIF